MLYPEHLYLVETPYKKRAMKLVATIATPDYFTARLVDVMTGTEYMTEPFTVGSTPIIIFDIDPDGDTDDFASVEKTVIP